MASSYIMAMVVKPFSPL